MKKTQLQKYKFRLGSLSPRRRQLLQEMCIPFTACNTEVNESYPEHLQSWEVALYLSKKKAEYFEYKSIADNEIIITADTVVALNEHILPKPSNDAQAKQFLQLLSGKMHVVFTGVTLKSKKLQHSFLSESKVWFRELTKEEIEWYVENYKPFDKAGAYGIQEWIGYVGIERIEGSFYNVMGLPTSRLYTEILDFIQKIESSDAL